MIDWQKDFYQSVEQRGEKSKYFEEDLKLNYFTIPGITY
jgi:hypothetical protein